MYLEYGRCTASSALGEVSLPGYSDKNLWGEWEGSASSRNLAGAFLPYWLHWPAVLSSMASLTKPSESVLTRKMNITEQTYRFIALEPIRKTAFADLRRGPFLLSKSSENRAPQRLLTC